MNMLLLIKGGKIAPEAAAVLAIVAHLVVIAVRAEVNFVVVCGEESIALVIVDQ